VATPRPRASGRVAMQKTPAQPRSTTSMPTPRMTSSCIAVRKPAWGPVRSSTSRLVASASWRPSITVQPASHRGSAVVATDTARGRGRGDRPVGEQAVDRGGDHHRRRLAAVAALRQFPVELVVQLRRADLDDRRLVAAGVEPLGLVERPCPAGGAGLGGRRRGERRVGAAAGDGRGMAQQPPVGELGRRGRPGVDGELLDQQDRVGDHLCRGSLRAWPTGRCSGGGIARRRWRGWRWRLGGGWGCRRR
jgi:hypothetical protein